MADAQGKRRCRFEAILAAHGSDVVSYCRWRTDDPAEAEEAVADVLLTAWRRLDEIPEGKQIRLWLYATARRVIANRRRSARRLVALQYRLTLEPTTTGVEASGDDRHWLVHETLRRLGPADREVLLLAEWEGLSSDEIAAVLDCLPVTARGRLHRARRRFRALYEDLLEHERRHEPSPELIPPKECIEHV